jgi:activating signal cointegrator 1
MKALSLWPPWGSLIVAGLKRIETRGWKTSYRGPIAIHQTQLLHPETAQELWDDPELWRNVRACGFTSTKQIPTGCILGTANLMFCERMSDELIAAVPPEESALGNYAPGRFMWILRDVVKFETPIPAKGKQGLWEWEPPR